MEGSQEVAERSKKLGIRSLVLGILSLGCGFLTGIPAIILGILSINKGKVAGTGTPPPKGLAIGGIVTGAIGLIFGTLTALAIIASLATPFFARVQDEARARVEAENAALEHPAVPTDEALDQ
ncbi:MAG: DUF4190 domain-containing protein [Verrucomicrobiota bacterium]